MGGSGSSGLSGGMGGMQEGGDCPRKFEATLVDVLPTGNASYAEHLKEGDDLIISITNNETSILLSHNNINIGYLPPQKSNIIQCIKEGWKYSASIIAVTGNQSSPQIRVLVVGAL
jgi:hypothetical protein